MEQPKTRESERTLEELRGTVKKIVPKSYALDYLLYLPDNYGRPQGVRYPLVLFLHGKGERGNELDAVKKHAISSLNSFQEQYDFILLAPQCPLETWWVEQLDGLDALLDEICGSYRVDLSRIYLTGISMGGFGSWHYAVHRPGRFAAVAPICGGGSHWHGFPEKVASIKRVPIWAFHGADDDVVPLSASQEMVDTLDAAGGNVRMTVYPGVKHDSWTQTYANPELYIWMFRHALSKPDG